ncbi:MAG TPA: LytTR family DNA-binding domain-containing protein [Candidatus Acidoferrales bacterium]|nr:LytTR family DNA-binding domain-containing protein [Bryobacteraceae bacterium]HTS65280.1 LytTR family DNA-binding domain-containing protein [Candidatus Acidoferrales bacterium]
MTGLIVDDEAAARSRLTRMLSKHPEVQIAGEASDGLQAIECIQRLRPDLVFLDVQMPGLDGFQVIRSIPAEVPRPLIIFVTGFDRHALEAFEANALAYLLKPVEKEQLAQVLERAAKLCAFDRLRVEEDRRVAEMARSRAPALEQIVARKRDRFVLLNPDEILYFSAEDGLVKAKTAAESYVVNYQLAELEAALAQAFFRARRSALVNLRRVKEIRPFFKSSFVLAMPDAAEIAVSARQAKLLRLRIPGL